MFDWTYRFFFGENKNVMNQYVSVDERRPAGKQVFIVKLPECPFLPSKEAELRQYMIDIFIITGPYVGCETMLHQMIHRMCMHGNMCDVCLIHLDNKITCPQCANRQWCSQTCTQKDFYHTCGWRV